ncbi:hypothetical protein VTJ04DRAFT_8171 [Mycothermus thermophilus]|uniref:uncharacterized protein n=1 Tax=Humicola insolens TaxID=85995 RepID=UPI003744881A
MNGFNEKRPLLEEDDPFAPKGNIVSAFDAFPKSKPQYVTHTASGGKWTVAMMLVSFILFCAELSRWWRGEEEHTFAVEKGIGHVLPINIDVVVKMRCEDLHVNVQDAAGDRIHAAERLKRDPTLWAHWVDGKGVHRLGRDAQGRVITGEGYTGGAAVEHDEGFGEEHIHDIVALGLRKAKWGKTPRLWGATPDSCRIYGTLELNKVQGDFHFTARGHGYMGGGTHLDHSAFNFSHIISELSFGPFLPSLVNPLDRTVNLAPVHFYRFQYFLSVVPTIYSVGRPEERGSSSIFTNQYAVTEQSREVAENVVPGIFVKYDIEPILLNIVETRDSLFLFTIKVINVISGVLVAGHWGYRLTDWAKEVLGRKRQQSQGMLGVKGHEDE